MSKEFFYLYVMLPDYLSDWLFNQFGDKEFNHIVFPRSSVEHKIIKIFLTTKPKDLQPDLIHCGMTKILIPYFTGRDPCYYNFLPKKAIGILIKTIQDRFDVELWSYMSNFIKSSSLKEDLIYAWMERNNINETEKNFNAIVKRYDRLRMAYRNRERQKKFRKKSQ